MNYPGSARAHVHTIFAFQNHVVQANERQRFLVLKRRCCHLVFINHTHYNSWVILGVGVLGQREGGYTLDNSLRLPWLKLILNKTNFSKIQYMKWQELKMVLISSVSSFSVYTHVNLHTAPNIQSTKKEHILSNHVHIQRI